MNISEPLPVTDPVTEPEQITEESTEIIIGQDEDNAAKTEDASLTSVSNRLILLLDFYIFLFVCTQLMK